MTDFSKYKNITVDHDTYATITRLQTKITPDVKLSRSQVVKTLVNKEARKLNGRFSKQRCISRKKYNTHFDCATAGYLNAMGLMRELGEAEVNRSQITVQFKCKTYDSVQNYSKLLWNIITTDIANNFFTIVQMIGVATK